MDMRFVCVVGVIVLVAMCTLGTVECSNPCCMPEKWTAKLLQSIGEYNQDEDAASLAYGSSEYYYDSVGNQAAYRQTLDNQTAHTHTESWVIFKYSTNKKYVVHDGKCDTLYLEETMIPRCIPDDAAFLGTHFYPSMSKVDFWLITGEGNGETRRLGVSQNGCLPMSLSELSVTDGPDFVLSMNMYQNVTKGIANPLVFIVPSICK